MALTHNTDLRNDFCDEVNASINVNPPGSFILLVGVSEVATMVLSNPAFDASASGQMDLDVSPEPTDTDATGNAAPVETFDFVDGDAKVIFSGVVGTDVTLTKAIIATDDIVKLTSFTYIATQ